MSYRLEKPYSEKEKLDFIVKYNHNMNLLIEITEDGVYALEPDEIMKDGQIIKNPNYAKEVRLKEIEQEIAQIEQSYTDYLNSEVEYTNGKTYRIRYAEESYQALLATETTLQAAQTPSSIFPLLIWDSTGIEQNAVEMSAGELLALSVFLTGLQQTAWNERKTSIAKLEAERLSLVGE